MTGRKGVAAAIAARYDGGDFYLARPTEPGGDYTLRDKADDTAIAIVRRRKNNAVMRRWMARPINSPESAGWRLYGPDMLDVGRSAYRAWKPTDCST